MYRLVKRWPTALAAAAILAGLLIALLPPADMPTHAAHAAGLALGTIALLATGAVPEFIAALCFFAIAVLIKLAPVPVIFSGFTSSAFWLVFGGLLIGAGVRRTGLAQRLARRITGRIGGSYTAVIVGIAALGLTMSFLIPSTLSRILIMMPIVLAIADRLGFTVGRPGRAGMVLASAFVTMIPGFMIFPATVPAMVLAGAAETLYGYTPTYGSWLLLHFPVLGFLKALVITGFVLWLFPDKLGATDDDKPAEPQKAWGGQERTMAALLILALALWVTDFAHGISPAWVALGIGTLCVLPLVGIVTPAEFNERVNFGTLIYIAGMLGIGAVIAETGVGSYLADHALAVLQLEPGAHLRTFSMVSGLTALLAMLTTTPGVAAVLTPLAGTLAQGADLPVEAVLMMTVVGYSTLILPYQAPPLVVAMQLGEIPMAAGNKLCLAVLAVTVFVLLPLDYLWWVALGWLG